MFNVCVVIYSIIAILQKYDALYKLRDSCAVFCSFWIYIYRKISAKSLLRIVTQVCGIWYFVWFVSPLFLCYSRINWSQKYSCNSFVIAMNVQTLWYGGWQNSAKTVYTKWRFLFLPLVKRWCWCSGLSVHRHNFYYVAVALVFGNSFASSKLQAPFFQY
jgi:hypothetical protein